ncbi:hypothetical protein BPNPMPFG_000904 [Mesorhizobium sp. AR07]|uniref:hypothetical protein n=1 Tax=Mesorhizobium sp. AR07 TaxID=2865838 RepID=UPI00215F7796|nr:hypothetical protein [Mesorhizobium sp. AR07]UVK45374.1 hypothetical protein BPNPMPFG_000904 [Mesorhizobium sp. AR07]
MCSYDQYLAGQRVSAQRAQQAFEAQQQALYAKSPAELAAAARAQASAQYNDNENPAARADRIETAGKLALATANNTLSEAQKERARSLDQTLAGQQLDISLIGKTAGETARLRLEFDQIAQVRAEAARNNVAVDEAEILRIKQKAAEYGKVADAAARANLAHDLSFERDQLFRSPQDQDVASRLQSAGLPVDLNSYEAGLIRANQQLEIQRKQWEDIRDVGRDAIDTLLDPDSWNNFGDAAKKIGLDILGEFTKLSLNNPLKNLFYGDNLPTLDSAGGIGGFIGTLLGGDFAGGASKSVGAMSVNAGSVVVTGSIGATGSLGSLASNVTKLLTGGNDNSAAGAGNMSLFASAIKSIESSGNYSAVGPVLGNGDQALGAYQVMKSNLQSWTQEAFGKAMSASQFLADPGAQDAVFQQQFGKLLSKFGNSQDAASAWFTGGPLSKNAGATDVLGTTGSAYVDKFNAALANLDSTTTAATKSLGGFGSGLGQLGNALNQFPAAPSLGGGGLGSWLSSLLGGGMSLSPAAAGDIASGSWGLFDIGGYTGDGPRRKPAGIVHAGEVVWSQDDVSRAGGVGVVEAMRLGRRGYATGGAAIEGGFAMPATGTYGGGPTWSSNGGSQTREVLHRIVVEEGPMFRTTIRSESQDVAVEVVRGNDAARADYYNAGGNPR